MLLTMQTANLLSFILALSPIIVVLVLMVGFRWGGAKAGPARWLVALIVSILFLGANPIVLAHSQTKGVLFTLFVLYIIWIVLFDGDLSEDAVRTWAY